MHMLRGEKHYMKSPPGFQRFIEECSPSGVNSQEHRLFWHQVFPDVLHAAGNHGATDLWWEAPSPGWATEELQAGLVSPVLLQRLPGTSDGSRPPSYTREREGRTFSINREELVPLQAGYHQRHLQALVLLGIELLGWDGILPKETDF